MKKNDLIRLHHILESIEIIEEYSKDLNFTKFYEDRLVKDACSRQLENLCEASINLSKDIKEKYPFISWSDMAGMRIILAHKYFAVDSGILWDTIKNQLPSLKETIIDMIDQLERN